MNHDPRSIPTSPTAHTVDRPTWLEHRLNLLAEEKELTRQRDRVAARRRALPRVKIDVDYVFASRSGPVALAELFDGRSQLIVHHFMFGPGWEQGCVGCSFTADHIESALIHLNHHDVTVVRVSRAPMEEIDPFWRRMGWRAPWVSSFGNRFNYDFHVSFTAEQMSRGEAYHNYRYGTPYGDECSGLSVFQRDDQGQIYHTYSTYARGDEMVDTTYMLLDLTPQGRNELVHGNLFDWVRHHDRYSSDERVADDGRVEEVR